MPADLAWTLTVIASRCDQHGRGSRQTTKTIAAKTGKSVKQTQREIVRLRELGLIVPGDDSLVAHLPAGQRPAVYDVPLHLKGPKPQKESRNKSGRRKPDDEPDTPPMEGAPPLQGDSPHGRDADTPLARGTDTPLARGTEESFEEPVEQPSLSARESLPGSLADDDRERGGEDFSNRPDDQRHRWAIEAGCPGHLAAAVVDELERWHEVERFGWWKRVHGRGDLPRLVRESLDRLAGVDRPAARTSRHQPYTNNISDDDYRKYAERGRQPDLDTPDLDTIWFGPTTLGALN
ncbi:hypothetical protein [Verrucosispora sp. WMMC514]|uniref:hypothetical protein n=1 Tax=Verrucosispora sp. WMMC514 TaxID=3015156 RepID=UPI00248D328E|nr:hypothetical protein [Verrucosispora sp. WMMC514]WBB94117.1 hypothetical protein O7597_14810 [Verrucosispora sp. WMMC514]